MSWIDGYFENKSFVENTLTVASGSKGGFRINFDSSTTMADPGAGDFRIDATNANIAISTTGAVGSLNIDPILTSFQVGGTIRIESNAAADTSFIQATITSITDNITWFQFGITTISSAAFTNAEACVLNYVDSAETPTYTSLDDASLPAAAANNNLIVSLTKIKANLSTAKRCLAISDGSVYRGIGEIVLVDDPTTVCIVTANNAALTWSVTAGGIGNAFCVLTASAAHGLTAGVCNKSGGLTVANLHVASASTGWAANTLIPINTIDSTTVITTDYPIGALAGTAPVISEATDKCKIASFILPPALATSRFKIHAPLKVTNTANSKVVSIDLSGTELWSPSTLVSNAGHFAEYVFYNKNSTAIQETRAASASTSQVGQQAIPSTAAVETSGGAAVITLYGTPSVVNELVGIRSLWASMWY